jgi:hypothetical protein
MLIDQYAGTEVSHSLYPHWRGGYYYAARPKGDANAPLGLLYVSRWSTAEKAAQFAVIYANSLAKRYRDVQFVAGGKSVPVPGKPMAWTGTRQWQTEEGTVTIEVEGDEVLVTESLDNDTTTRLAHDVFPANVLAAK